jgi:23S rRNA (uracil1939-C5)-methyltransferase
VLELYGGIGLFSLFLAQRGAVAMVCEADAAAVECGEAAARANGNLLVRYERAETGAFLERFRRSSMRMPDVVVADPPRTGLGKGIAKRIADLRAKRIVLVSCDPATLARDAAALRDHGYRLERATPIDLFPQTPHVETVAAFGR